jgi:ABC-2 type transport system ATP-binding protein
MNDAFRAEGLRKAFGSRVVLDALDLSIAPGTALGLLGANGVGKTTLIRILLGLLPADGGRALVDGEDAQALSPALRERIGYVPQMPGQFAWLTGQAMLGYVAAFYPTFDKTYARDLAKRWDISLKTQIGVLSPGQQQRLSILRALAPRPDFVILDEPIASLDPVTRIAVIDELQRIRGERKITIIFSSHILGDLQRLCTEFAILEHGKIAARDSVDAFSRLVQVTLEGPEEVMRTLDLSACRRERNSREGERIVLLPDDQVERWVVTLPAGVSVKARERDLELVVSEWMR